MCSGWTGPAPSCCRWRPGLRRSAGSTAGSRPSSSSGSRRSNSWRQTPTSPEDNTWFRFRNTHLPTYSVTTWNMWKHPKQETAHLPDKSRTFTDPTCKSGLKLLLCHLMYHFNSIAEGYHIRPRTFSCGHSHGQPQADVQNALKYTEQSKTQKNQRDKLVL